MDRIGAFSPHTGIEDVMTPQSEIGHANLPQGLRIVPSDDIAQAALSGALPATLQEQFARFLEPQIRFRELLMPEVLFAVLSRCRESLGREALANPNGAAARTAAALDGLLEDKQLCDMFRNLLLNG